METTGRSRGTLGGQLNHPLLGNAATRDTWEIWTIRRSSTVFDHFIGHVKRPSLRFFGRPDYFYSVKYTVKYAAATTINPVIEVAFEDGVCSFVSDRDFSALMLTLRFELVTAA